MPFFIFFSKNLDAKKFENQHYGLVLKIVGCSQDDLIYELDDLIWKVQYLLSAIWGFCLWVKNTKIWNPVVLEIWPLALLDSQFYPASLN